MTQVTSFKPSEPSEPTLLLVEDEFYTRWSAAEYFRMDGFTVVEAIDVSEALAVLTSGKPIDVIFTDLNLPGDRDGSFLADWLAKHRPSTPLILTSGKADGAHLISPGPLRRFVLKPYNLAEVATLLRRMLKGGWAMP